MEAAVDAAYTLGTLRHVVISHGGWGVTEKVVNRDGSPASLDGFTKTLELYLTGTYNVLRLTAARMATNAPNDDGERGSVVATASIAGYEGQIGQSAYAAAKAGVIGLTLAGARDLSSVGIRLNTIAPGTMHTAMMETRRGGGAGQVPVERAVPEASRQARGVRRPRAAPARQRLPQRRGRPARRGPAVRSALGDLLVLLAEQPLLGDRGDESPVGGEHPSLSEPQGVRHRRRRLVVEKPVVDPARSVEPDAVVERGERRSPRAAAGCRAARAPRTAGSGR